MSAVPPETSPAPALRALHVVSHTHWDREWYHPLERFRQRLVALIDDLLDAPSEPGRAFLLDGQAILLADYLEVRPERASLLAALLVDGRLEAGPWYVLPDELIPSGEALVRNLLAGRDELRRLGGAPPPVLYCPDSFGHPAILPDLAAGFGLELVLLWRGYGGARWPAGDVARWRGAAGADVLLYHLPPDGYEFGSSLPNTDADALPRWEQLYSVMAPRARTGVAILLNGADHHARQRGLPAALRAIASAAGPVIVQGSPLRTACRALIDAASRVLIPTVQGELRDSYGYTWTLQGTLGSRAAQKRRNAIAERILLRDVEPWMALAQHSSAPSPAPALLRHAWRSLLQTHPHDTLCGTATDDVARASDARLRAVHAQARGLREDALLSIIGHDREHSRSTTAWQPALVIRNPVARRRSGVADVVLSATVADVAVGPGSATKQGARRRAPSLRADGLPFQLLLREERVALTESPRAYPDADVVIEARAVAWVSDIGGYSVEVRGQRGAPRGQVPNPVAVTESALDNGIVRLEIDDSGIVSLHEHGTGRTIPDLIAFERRRDVGDLYTPALRDILQGAVLRRRRIVYRGPLRGELRLDHTMHGERSRLAVTMTVLLQLDANSRFLRVRVRGENRAHDHRLRMRIATGVADARTVADAAFHSVERVLPSLTAADSAMETLVATAPLHRWVTHFGAGAGTTLVSDGLAEYESTDDGGIFITLLRAVGNLSRHDLPERPGHAGWPSPTPDAQGRGPFEACVSIAMHAGDGAQTRDEIEQIADDVLTPINGETLRSNLSSPGIHGGLELHGSGLAFSAACPARRDGFMVLRCVNRSDRPARGEWRFRTGPADAYRARLDEEFIGAIQVSDGVIAFDAAPHEIVTIIAR